MSPRNELCILFHRTFRCVYQTDLQSVTTPELPFPSIAHRPGYKNPLQPCFAGLGAIPNLLFSYFLFRTCYFYLRNFGAFSFAASGGTFFPCPFFRFSARLRITNQFVFFDVFLFFCGVMFFFICFPSFFRLLL